MMSRPREGLALFTGTLFVGTLLAGTLFTGQATAQERDLLVKVTRLMVAPDNVLTDSSILILNGKVQFVGAEIHEDAA